VTVNQKFFSAGWLFNVMAINSILRSNNGNKYLLYVYESTVLPQVQRFNYN